MFEKLNMINRRPTPYEVVTTADLWTDEYVSARMLECHLDPEVDLSSRRHDFIDRSARWITDRFQLESGAAVCDFGCGPGLYTSRFARAGATVTGVDFSPRSIAHARDEAARHGLNISYECRDYLEFATDRRFDLITMIFCDLCALKPASRSVMLGKFGDLLAPGGSVLLDVVTRNFMASINEGLSVEYSAKDGFWSAQPYYAFETTFKYELEGIYLGKHTIIEQGRTRELYNWLQCYTPESLAAEFAAAGLKITGTYANVAGDAYDPSTPEMAVTAVKA